MGVVYMWVRNVLYGIIQKVVTSLTGWLTDKRVTAAQMLILQHFPSLFGLQPSPLQEVLVFQVHSGDFVQMVNISETIAGVLSQILVVRMRL